MALQRIALLGVDAGTQGIRVVAIDAAGTLLSSRSREFSLSMGQAAREQSPEMWWQILLPLLRETANALKMLARPATPIAISVTSTSGTVIPLAADHTLVHDALMYDDNRAVIQAGRCRDVARGAGSASGFGTSFGLPKIVWFAETWPREAARIAFWAHAADFLIGRLSGAWNITDPTNALKTGFDPERNAWPDFITEVLAIPAEWLPEVAPSGSRVGTLRREVAEATGLPVEMLVTTGMTDGCASQIAAGAVHPGEWSTTIGTTMVIKGVTRKPIVDPAGRLYNHLHPEGWWMPGGASNTGAAWIARDYAGQDLELLDAGAREVIPTSCIAYPLLHEGERFPFVAPAARGFEPAGLSEPTRYAARLEGVAYLERLAYEMIENLSGEGIERVSTAGGGSRGDTWLAIRANVLRKPIVRMRHPDAAVGAAIIAASRTHFDGLGAAARAMTQTDRVIEPGALADCYDDGYGRFVQALTRRGYLTDMEIPA